VDITFRQVKQRWHLTPTMKRKDIIDKHWSYLKLMTRMQPA